MMKKEKVMNRNSKKIYRINEVKIKNLKGISNCEILFPDDMNVTAIMGTNGSGKSTILHALSCIFKPIKYSSKNNNKFSDFFTPHKATTWAGSCFEVYFKQGVLEPVPGKKPAFKKVENSSIISVTYEKKKSSRVRDSRWTPYYSRRLERESSFIGLQELATLSDDSTASRHSSYRKLDSYSESQKKEILKCLTRIFQADYTDVFECKSERSKKLFWGVVKNGVEYTEHTMGAGEKRVVSIIKTILIDDLSPNGLLIIDEIDALLHEKAFHNLVDILVELSRDLCIEIVFTTHRESIIKFKDKVNIVSIWNMGSGVKALPGVSSEALRQLSNVEPDMLNVFVEDDLAKFVIERIIEEEEWLSLVKISLFGVAENSAAVLYGLLVAEKDIAKVIAVTDGDVGIGSECKKRMVNKVIGGNNRIIEEQKLIVSEKIFNFNLDEHVYEKGGRPERCHKKWLEEIDIENVDQGDKKTFEKIKNHSLSIRGLSHGHEYYRRMSDELRVDDVEKIVLRMISKYSPMWENYVCDVKKEMKRIIDMILR